MLTVRHASASGRLDEMWTFDPREQRLEVLVRLGSVSVALPVLVCSKANPRLGAHPLVRVDGESWRVLPERYVRVWRHRIEALSAISCGIGDVLDFGQHVVLTNAPPNVSAELEAL